MKSFNELKELVKVEFEKVWMRTNGKTDSKMVKYCMDKTAGIVELENGEYICFDKPSIQTSFCFGYGYCGMSTDEEYQDAKDCSVAAKEKNNFVSENMRTFYEWDKLLNTNIKDIFVINQYRSHRASGKNKLGKLVTREYIERFNENYICKLTPADFENLKSELANQKAKFAKRLETYWKRFGSSKLRTWTYLVD